MSNMSCYDGLLKSVKGETLNSSKIKPNEDLLVSGSAYLKKRLQDPVFKAAYEAEQLRAKIAMVFKEKRKACENYPI
ncbi:MAG: hypothetical protein HQL69_14870 [Magnetococcales bacterium]|nr:hypothetical protein [Magnetococcales bacterium]